MCALSKTFVQEYEHESGHNRKRCSYFKVYRLIDIMYSRDEDATISKSAGSSISWLYTPPPPACTHLVLRIVTSLKNRWLNLIRLHLFSFKSIYLIARDDSHCIRKNWRRDRSLKWTHPSSRTIMRIKCHPSWPVLNFPWIFFTKCLAADKAQCTQYLHVHHRTGAHLLKPFHK